VPRVGKVQNADILWIMSKAKAGRLIQELNKRGFEIEETERNNEKADMALKTMKPPGVPLSAFTTTRLADFVQQLRELEKRKEKPIFGSS
jgi:hypothetical protein